MSRGHVIELLLDSDEIELLRDCLQGAIDMYLGADELDRAVRAAKLVNQMTEDSAQHVQWWTWVRR